MEDGSSCVRFVCLRFGAPDGSCYWVSGKTCHHCSPAPCQQVTRGRFQDCGGRFEGRSFQLLNTSTALGSCSPRVRNLNLNSPTGAPNHPNPQIRQPLAQSFGCRVEVTSSVGTGRSCFGDLNQALLDGEVCGSLWWEIPGSPPWAALVRSCLPSRDPRRKICLRHTSRVSSRFSTQELPKPSP